MTLHPLAPNQPSYPYRVANPGAEPVVSVITPFYNTGRMFFETANSLLRQSLQQWEWLIINDGSTEPEALRCLLAFRHTDPRIRVIDTPNAGPSKARNLGVAASQAPYLFFLDSDDLLVPTALEQMVWTLVSHPGSSFTTSWTAVFGGENLRSQRGFNTRYAFLYDNTVTALSMVRRSVYIQVGGFTESMRGGLEDYEFWMRCAAHGFWGHDIPSELVWIRRKQLAEYSGYRWGFQEDQTAMPRFRQQMRAQYPQLFRDGVPTPVDDAGPQTAHQLVDPFHPFTNTLVPQGKRRILLLLPAIRVGGADRFALDVAQGLAERGDRVSVALTRADETHTWFDELCQITPDVFDLPKFLRAGDFPRFLRYLIDSRSITHVWISNSMLGYQLLPFLRAYCPHVAFIDYNHIEQPFRHGGFPQVSIEHAELLDLQITSSQHLRTWMQERGADPERIAVCTTNIDIETWQPNPTLRSQIRAELGLAESQPVILFAARLSAQKRVRLAAEILLRLRDQGSSFTVLIAGDGEDLPWLRAFIRRHGLQSQVRLLGSVAHTRIRELLVASDILLLPSAHEGIALVLFEAMASGVVPIAADVGGQRELVLPDCGVLIAPDPHEAAAYTNALHKLLTDPPRRAVMACAGRQRICQHYTMPQMLDQMQALLDQASQLAQHAPRPAVPPGTGLAMAVLAIEHDQLELRLRRFAPAKWLLRLRHASFTQAGFAQIGVLRQVFERADRQIYVWRRSVMRLIKRSLGRRYSP
jgi:glycosyltransferase involved in cell wall biosynthesis